MKNRAQGLLLLTGVLLMSVAMTRADVPHQLSYQGRLLDDNGQPVTAAVTVDIGLFAAATGGSSVYSQDVGSVNAVNGLYAFHFGTNNAAFNAALTAAECWLELSIDGEVLSPRQRLVAVPYAIYSRESDPVWSAVSNGIATEASHGEVAYGWGNHANSDYATESHVGTATGSLHTTVSSEIDMDVAALSNAMDSVAFGGEVDPVYTSSVAARITLMDTSLWYTAYSWGNHATNSYATESYVGTATGSLHTTVSAEIDGDVTSATGALHTTVSVEIDGDVASLSNALDVVAFAGEVDPVYTSSVAARVTLMDTSLWHTAYSWGNHATNSYATESYVGTATGSLHSTVSAEIDGDVTSATGALHTTVSVEIDGDVATLSNALDVVAFAGEVDPVYTSSVAARITLMDTSLWHTAYSWGNHATNSYATESYVGTATGSLHSTVSAEIDDDVTSATGALHTTVSVEIDGDVASLSNALDVVAFAGEVDPVYTSSVAARITLMDTSIWHTAVGWGNHATNSYATEAYVDSATGSLHATVSTEIDGDVTSATGALHTTVSAEIVSDVAALSNMLDVVAFDGEIDPVYTSSVAARITLADTSLWHTAVGWGNHATNSYATEAYVGSATGSLHTTVSAEIDGDVTSATGALHTTVSAEIDSDVAALSNMLDVVAFDGEIDPVYTSSVAARITLADTSLWHTAVGWGNHATNSYATESYVDSATGALHTTVSAEIDSDVAALSNALDVVALAGEVDPVYTSSVAARIALADTSLWHTAVGWGNHATNSYLTSSTETDPLWGAVSNLYLRSATAATTYVARVGSTMTGRLTLPANGLLVGTTQLVITNGNVGIGTANPTNALAVNGTIKAKEVIVTVDGWADYVFDDGYRLMPLNDVERYIKAQGHLPDVPSTDEVEANGVRMGAMQAILLRKVEELTLHLIELERENDALAARVQELERSRSRPYNANSGYPTKD